MNRKIILGLTTAVLLATSAMAYDGHKKKCDGSKNFKSCNKSCNMKNKQGNSQMFVRMIMKLDLTEKQRAEVISIVKESKQNIINPSVAFSDSSFDKAEFIKLTKQKREARLEGKADTLEKVYKVLNSSQKKDLRTMLDMREVMEKSMHKNMKKGESCNVKNSDGRR